MEMQKMTSGEYFKSLKIIHLALIVGTLSFALVSIVLQIEEPGTVEQDIANGLLISVPVFALIGIFAGNLVFKKKIKEIDKQTFLKKKMELYRSAQIIKFALIQGPSFFAIVAYFLTGNYIYLGVVVILIIVLLMYTPTREKFKTDLELSKTESELISRSEAEIS